jgi:putative Holliday junction resolvase
MIRYPIASVDVGLKRVGMAVCYEGLSPLPIEPILRKNRDQAATDLMSVLKERSIQTLVVGIPKGGASEEEMSRRIHHFCSLLNFDGEIFFQDEYASSVEASDLTKGLGLKRDGTSDSIAAMIILSRWIEGQT